MLLSDPATKKAARAQAKTGRQEILDICPTLYDEGAAAEGGDRLVDEAADLRRSLRLEKVILHI